MEQPKILMHLNAHRRRSLLLQTEHGAAEQAYDANIGAYVHYLKAQAIAAGYTLQTDRGDPDESFSYSSGDDATNQTMHDWLHTLPDLWNWIP